MLQIWAALFYYKLEQKLLQIGEASLSQIGQVLLQLGQLLRIRATVITKYGSYYKLGQNVLEIGSGITN